MKRALIVLVALVGCRADAESLPVEPPPPPPPAEVARSVKLERVATGLRMPVALTFAPGDAERRLFIVEKPGYVRVLRGGKLDALPFLDVHDRVSGATEQGLLGLAFHPQFAKNGRFYVNYTDRKGDTRVVEFDREYHERELLWVKQPFNNHNGGDLVFGPDGKLYIGLGDGGWANDPFGHGQDPDALLAKMLRLDVDEPGRPKVHTVARGLRNPWRYAFDRKTGDLYIADVGQDRWEEIDLITKGGNYGWSVREAAHHFKPGPVGAQYVEPIIEYPHRPDLLPESKFSKHGTGLCVVGGYVYRGKKYPALQGVYLYGDYNLGTVFGLRYQDGKVTEYGTLLQQPKNISSFAEDADGELYILALDAGVFSVVVP